MWTFSIVFSLGYLWITITVNAASVDDVPVILTNQNMTVSLDCTAKLKPTVVYFAVRWYKEGPSSSLYGLVSRTPPNGRLRYYVDADTDIRLEVPRLNLVLPQVTCSHAGIYLCYMAAPVGEQNREGRVRLSVTGCPTEAPVISKKEVNLPVEKTPLNSQIFGFTNYMLVGFGFVLSVLLVSYVIYRKQKIAWLQKSKKFGKEPYPDPKCLPEKQDLLWIATLGPAPKKPDITAA